MARVYRWKCSGCKVVILLKAGEGVPAGAHGERGCLGGFGYLGDGDEAQALLDAADAEAHERWGVELTRARHWADGCRSLANCAKAMSYASRDLIAAAGHDVRLLSQAARILIGVLDNEINMAQLANGAGGAVAGIEDREPARPRPAPPPMPEPVEPSGIDPEPLPDVAEPPAVDAAAAIIDLAEPPVSVLAKGCPYCGSEDPEHRPSTCPELPF